MAVRRSNRAVQGLGRALVAIDDEADACLLDRFIAYRDEEAFAVIVRRHGALVWGICRRILGNHHDSEDAFQATFLVLAKKAASIKPREMLANWLYGVAYRVSLKARTAVARRGRLEKQMPVMPEPALAPQDPCLNLKPLLDLELARLPDKYRVAVILCDLEGKTGKEVARQLKIPEGTLFTRLRTAREILARRLERHRIALSVAAIEALLSGQSQATPSSALVAAGQAVISGVVSTHVTALSEGTLKAMSLTKIKIAIAVALLSSLIVIGGVHFLLQTGKAQEKEGDRAAPSSANDAADTPKQPAKRTEDPKIRDQAFTVSGRALDEEGNPIPDATIYLVSTNNSPERLLGTAISDKEGHYVFRDAKLPYRVPENDNQWESGCFQVFGKAPKRAFAWDGMKFLNIDKRLREIVEIARPGSFSPDDKIEINLRFALRKKIEGRIINEKGDAIAGVNLSLGGCDYLDATVKGGHDNLREFWAINQASAVMPEQFTAKTDEKGRFEFPNVPEGVICQVTIKHPDYAGKGLYTATSDNPPAIADDENPIVKLPLAITMHSVRLVRVKVQSKETGQPIEGMHVGGYQQQASGDFAEGKSDKDGNLTLKLPPGKYKLVGDPPRTSDLIRTRMDLVVENEPKEQAVVLRQELGCVLILKAIDANTGKGVPKVTFWEELDDESDNGKSRSTVQSSTVYVDNPTTNDKGELRVVAVPGKHRFGLYLPEGYESAEDDRGKGRNLELTAGKTVTETFRIRKK